jgi:hypothetical protein
MSGNSDIFIVFIFCCILSITISILTFFTYTCTDGTWVFENFEDKKCTKWPEKDKTEPACTTFTSVSECPSRCIWNTTTSLCGEPSPAPAPAQAQSTGEASSTSSVLDDVATAIESAEQRQEDQDKIISCTTRPGKFYSEWPTAISTCNARNTKALCESEDLSPIQVQGTAINRDKIPYKDLCYWDRLPSLDEAMEEDLQKDVSDALGSVTCSSKSDPVTSIPTSIELKIIGVPSDYTPTVDNGVSGTLLQTRFRDTPFATPINVTFFLVPKAGTYDIDGTLARFSITKMSTILASSEIFTVGEQSVMSFAFEFIEGVTVVASVEDWLCVK